MTQSTRYPPSTSRYPGSEEIRLERMRTRSVADPSQSPAGLEWPLRRCPSSALRRAGSASGAPGEFPGAVVGHELGAGAKGCKRARRGFSITTSARRRHAPALRGLTPYLAVAFRVVWQSPELYHVRPVAGGVTASWQRSSISRLPVAHERREIVRPQPSSRQRRTSVAGRGQGLG